MSKGWYFHSGSFNVICDSCGKKVKAGELRKRWDGLMVCEKDWEPRQPQDFIRVKQDRITPPWLRPQTTDVFNNVQGAYDSVAFTDSVAISVHYYKTITDSISFTDSNVNTISKVLTDSITMTDDLSKSISIVKTDSFSLAESRYFAEDYMVNNDDYVLPGFSAVLT